MKDRPGYFLFGIVLFMSLHSCIEEQNFDQFDDLRIEPTIEGSILYVEAPERTINIAIAANFYVQDFNFDGFSDAIFADRVLDGVVTYVMENTTSKDIDVTVEFLDAGDNVLDIESLHIDPAPTEMVLVEIPYGGTGRPLDIIRNTSAIRVSARNNGDATSVSDFPDPMVILKSSGKFRLSLK